MSGLVYTLRVVRCDDCHDEEFECIGGSLYAARASAADEGWTHEGPQSFTTTEDRCPKCSRARRSGFVAKVGSF